MNENKEGPKEDGSKGVGGLKVNPDQGVPLAGLGVGAAEGAAVGTCDLEDLPVPAAIEGCGLKGMPVDEEGLQLQC